MVNARSLRRNSRTYLCNCFGRIFASQPWVHTLSNLVFTKSWCCLHELTYTLLLNHAIHIYMVFSPKRWSIKKEAKLLNIKTTRKIEREGNIYPCHKALLPSWQSMIHRFSSSQELQKNNTKTVHITLRTKLSSHRISVNRFRKIVTRSMEFFPLK